MTRNGRTHFLNRRRRARRARARDGSSSGRAFDPVMGRFLSADPYIDGPQTTQGWNRYAYVHGRALSATDPSGFCVMNQASEPNPDLVGSFLGFMSSPIFISTRPGGILTGSLPDIGGRSEPGLLGNWNGCIPESALSWLSQYQANQGNIGAGSSALPPVTTPSSPPSGGQTTDSGHGAGDTAPEPPPCEYGPSTASGAFSAGVYRGAGGEVTMGLDNGHDFVTVRTGFGFGGGGSYNPKGGMPIQPADHSQSGAIRSVTAKFDFSIGVPWTRFSASFNAEFGPAYSSRDGFGWVADLDPEIGVMAKKGLHAGGSVGAQLTFYGIPAQAITSTGTCRAHW